jgi:hypothetical protein
LTSLAERQFSAYQSEFFRRRPAERPEKPRQPWGWTSVHAVLFGGDVDLVARKPTSLWSNRLVLPGLNAEGGKPDGAPGGEVLSLRGRRLEGAVLLDAHLRHRDKGKQYRVHRATVSTRSRRQPVAAPGPGK